jgi:hypothetical protein
MPYLPLVVTRFYSEKRSRSKNESKVVICFLMKLMLHELLLFRIQVKCKLGMEPLLPTGQEAWWAPELV